LNCQRICRNASLNSWFIIICWLTPKSFEGSSEKLEIAKFGLWSQSESGSKEDEEVENEADERPVVVLHNRCDADERCLADSRLSA
jgi:hypothetical protein